MVKYATEFEALRAAAEEAQSAMNAYLMLAETQGYISPDVSDVVTSSNDALTTLLQGLANGQLDTKIGEAFKNAVHALHLVIVREKARPNTLRRYKEQLRELEEESTRMADKAGKSKAPVPDEYTLRWNEANDYIKNYNLHPSMGDEGQNNSYSITPLRNELKRAYAALYRAVKRSDNNLLVNLQYSGIEDDLAQTINDDQTHQKGSRTTTDETGSKRRSLGSLVSTLGKLSWRKSRGSTASTKKTDFTEEDSTASYVSNTIAGPSSEGDRGLHGEGGRGYL
ncbi:hypothetical protein NCC49_004511 [Naganishia albida]|nr:hypothetical protein NCC49_004511 [Naganishia albida]